MSTRAELLRQLQERLPSCAPTDAGPWLELQPTPALLPDVATTLMQTYHCEFASLVVEATDASDGYCLRYFFYQPVDGVLIVLHLVIAADTALPAISPHVYAAAWHEREVEDLFGIPFEGHPFLGDYVLHDAVWPEHVAPMRRSFDARHRVTEPGLGMEWKPRRILQQEGSIAFPVGPVWADYNEAGLWLLETPGEQIYECQTRLFYKYRAVEKIAEGLTPARGLLLAERFSGNSAFAHAWAYCRALEAIAACEIPPRARVLRAVFAELERIRYHAATLAELAGSTSLAVGKSMSQEAEEHLLRLSAQLCGHRYLFGVCVPGGVSFDPSPATLGGLKAGITAMAGELARLERRFVHTSSHLDRLEEMGTLRPDVADQYGVVGPVARASGRTVDLRRALPYGIYADQRPEVAHETEGDGYARMRVYFTEIRVSATLICVLLDSLPDGPVATTCPIHPGAALAWTEAPAGGTFHWLRIDEDGLIQRWRIAPPGFRNWHAFHRALEGAAFQDFHIIMASFGLSVAESDR
ncbi:MAG TPA: NADH-quinone oxidoreductase subunit C [Nevskiaceae bacterium]|nr:NADH-quinone oxidoreductase subunit C [Nevskiaceae bacterium]